MIWEMAPKPILTLEETQNLRRSLSANGREQAWTFVVTNAWSLSAVQDELALRESYRDDPERQNSSMKPNASPRIFIDAYIEALKDAIQIILDQQAQPQ